MLSKQYLDTARTIRRAAQTMSDQHVAGQLKALAEDYDRALVVAYARRVYPGAKILERD